MKTKHYITATLIALVFATASIQAQTARRPKTQEREEKAKTTQAQTRKTSSQKAKSTQPARKAQSQQASRQRAAAPARKVNSQQARQNKAAPARKVNTQQARHNLAAPARKVNTQQARQNKAAPARKVNTQQARHNQAAPGRSLSNAEKRPGSITTPKNTRPSYRTSANNSYATPRYKAPKNTVKYHNWNYYGGHHYHYAYPTHKVKIRYHHDTYLHNYNVLYYPTYTNIYWNRHMYRNYRNWYPEYHWNYNYGHRIQTISVFDAQYNLGEVAMVYGRVYATWHNKETDDYLLFFGGDFPYQQLTVVLPGNVARRFSWRPERYFLGEHITTTGLITTFDGSPEIVVKNKRQVGIY